MGGLLNQPTAHWRAFTALAVLALTVLTPAPALASKEAEEEAYRLYQAAAEDFTANDFEAAVDKLTQAYALFPKPIILMKKAEALEHLGRIEAAHAAFSEVAAENKRMRQKVDDSLRRLQIQLDKPVQVSVLSGRLTGARILLDGADTGQTTPSVLAVERGPHTVRIERDGYTSWESEGFVAHGVESMTVEATLRKLQGSASVRLATGTWLGTTVSIDGEPVRATGTGTTPSAPRTLDAGRHELVCARAGIEQPFEASFTVADGRQVDLVCQLAEPYDPTMDILGWSLVGVGAAGVAGGVFLLVDYFDELSQADDSHALPKSQQVRLVSNKQYFGPVLLGVGVAAAATGVVLLLVDFGDDDEAAALAPAVTPLRGGISAGLTGRF